ncbi:MAG: ABC transporter substrate-binding protein [Erythrobacter sp.]
MFAIVSCNAPDSVDATQSQTGEAIDELPRFVSLNPCTDAILVEIANPQQVLALSHFSHDEAASSIDIDRARQFDVTGGTVEEVMALSPDYVLASAFSRPAKMQALRDFGIQTEMFGEARDPLASFAQIERIAALAGHPERGQKLIASIEQALELSAAPAGYEPINTMVWQPGQIVPGEATLIGGLLDHAGFESHSAARGLKQADFVSLETVLADPPELLLIAGRSGGQRHPTLINLVKTQVETFDSKLIFCAATTIEHATQRLVQIREQMR